VTVWDSRLAVAGLSIEYEARHLRVEARWPTRASRNAIDTILHITSVAAEGEPVVVVPPTRINLLSASARDGLLRGSGRGDDRDVLRKLVDAIVTDLWNVYREQRPTTRPDPEKASSKVDWLLYPIWPAVGSTGIAAAPGSFKSWTGQAIALSMATGQEVLKGNTRPPAEPEEVLYLDWEGDHSTFAARLRALCFGAGIELRPWLPYREMRTPLVDAAADLADEIAERGYRGVVVDSLSAGIGGTLIDDERANLFWDAIRVLGVPAFVIAHKSAQAGRERNARFFGSVMHEARVRVAWNVERADDDDTVRWDCFKDNATGRAGKRLAWTWDAHNGTDEDPDALMAMAANGVNPNNVNLEPRPEGGPQGPSPQQMRILDAIKRVGPSMPGELANVSGVPPASVRAQLAKLADRGLVERAVDGRYGPPQ